jgi:diguanylate cyclase (GGDEF)-like protein
MFENIFDNSVALFIQAVLLIICVISVARKLAKRRYVRLPQFFAVAYCVLIWSAVAALRYVIHVDIVIYLTVFLPYVISAFALIFLFRFILSFYNIRVTRHVLTVACIFPINILLVTIFSYAGVLNSNGWGSLMRSNAEVSFEPYNTVTGVAGPWMKISLIVSVCIAAAMFLIALRNHSKLTKIYRPASEKVLTGTIFILIGYGLTIISIRLPFFDVFALGSFIIALGLFFKSTLKSQGLVFLAQAKKDIIQYLDQCIFILDDEKKIVFCNEMAEKTLDQRRGDSYLALIERLGKETAKCVKLKGDENGQDYYFNVGEELRIYNLREKPIFDKKERQIGAFAVYSDVTQNRKLIQRLEEGAGRDALTGLHNRSMMEKLKVELDKPESLPLAVVIFDLNDLKVTNDNYGHQSGDVMLRVCGDALTEKAPPTAQAGRIGGDEFMLLLPQTAGLEAEAVMHDVRQYLKNVRDYPFNIVMAMGCGIKENENQKLNEVMEIADKAMYADKKKIKGGAEIRSMETKLI